MTDINQDLLQLKNRIENSMYQILIRESEEDHERMGLMERISDDRLRSMLPNLSVSSLHVLDVIHLHDSIKGIDIARNIGITKGAVSKITRKLLNEGLIDKTQLPANQKEIYFSTTPLGAELADLHRLFHQEKDKKVVELLTSFDTASLEIVADFLEKLADMQDAVKFKS